MALIYNQCCYLISVKLLDKETGLGNVMIALIISRILSLFDSPLEIFVFSSKEKTLKNLVENSRDVLTSL